MQESCKRLDNNKDMENSRIMYVKHQRLSILLYTIIKMFFNEIGKEVNCSGSALFSCIHERNVFIVPEHVSFHHVMKNGASSTLRRL